MTRSFRSGISTLGLSVLGSVILVTAMVLFRPAAPPVAATERTVGVLVHDAERTSPGYMLVAPKHYTRTYLIDNNGQVVRTWDSKYVPGQSAYLLPDGHLLRACMVQVQGGGTGGGEGGRIEEYDWDGNLVWEFDYATRDYQLHHDMPIDPGPQPPTPGPGNSTVPAMALIAGGSYEMGDHHGLGGTEHANDELPVHRVSLDSFYMGVTEVTSQQYVEFLNSALGQGTIEVRDGLVYRKGSSEVYVETSSAVSYSSIGYSGAAFAVADGRATHPVVGVRWFGAAAYTNWLSTLQGYPACYDESWKCDRSGSGYRLPTEAEWEYAGRGGQYAPYRVYPWGDEADPARANWPNSGNPYETGALPWTTPVAFYDGSLRQKADFNWPGDTATYQTSSGANAYGLYDMAGNVWEWCHDWYGRDYYAGSPETNPPGPLVGSPMPDGQPYRVLRGGNWYNGPEGHSRVSNRDPAYYRGPDDPNHAWYHVGFRVARTHSGATQ